MLLKTIRYTCDGDVDIVPLQGRDFIIVGQSGTVRRPRRNVVRQHFGETRLIGQEIGQLVCRNLGKSIVAWREQSERVTCSSSNQRI